MSQISVIIPTYNRCELVQKAIDSVLAQTFTDYEIIVIDDGSTDETPHVIPQKYGKHIRYVWQENGGSSTARNNGLRFACGDFAAFLDSDDLWLPEKLQQQFNLMNANQDIGAVLTQAVYMTADGHILSNQVIGADLPGKLITWEEQFFKPLPCGGSTAMVRREEFLKLGGFDDKITFAEDWDAWLRIAIEHSVVWLAVPLALIRQTPNAMTITFTPEKIQNKFRWILLILERADRLTGQKLARSKVANQKDRICFEIAFQALAAGYPTIAGDILSRTISDPAHTDDIEETIANSLIQSIPVLINSKQTEIELDDFQGQVEKLLSSRSILEKVNRKILRTRLILIQKYAQFQKAPLAKRWFIAFVLMLQHPSILWDMKFRFVLKQLLQGR